MRARHLLAGALTAGLTLLAATPAAAQSNTETATPVIPANSKWEPYRTSGFTAPAGLLCEFPLASEPLIDEERVAVLDTFDDGSPRKELYMGDLRVRYTNLDTGATVEVDLGGIAFVEYGADGSYVMTSIGPVGFGFRPTDGYPAGMWTFDGYHQVYTAPQRAYREVLVDHGTEHNVCTDLD